MAMQVMGYYGVNNAGQGVGPASYPAPVMVPVNNYSSNGSGADAYIQSAVAAAPIGAGVMPGHSATNGVREAKGFFLRAKGTATSTRGMAAKAAAATNGRSALLGSVTGAIKSSMIFNGLLSLAINGWKLYNKQETTADAGANFAGDMTSAVVGGAAAGVASAAGTFILAGILGTGLPLTLAGIAIGAAAYFVADNVLRGTNFFNSIKSKVHSMIGG
jgi:hypothetical protein